MTYPFNRAVHVFLCTALVVQLTGCGTLLYPERRGLKAGHLDAGVVILDAIGLLFFLIPGIIAFAVDFSNGTIYLPASTTTVVVPRGAKLREIKFDPKHTTIAEVEAIIKKETGQSVQLTQNNMEVTRLQSKDEMMARFDAAGTAPVQLALKEDL